MSSPQSYEVIVVDLSSVEPFQKKLALPSTALVDVITSMLYSYPEGIWDDEIWITLEKYVQFDQMTDVVLDNYGIILEELCNALDKIVDRALTPYAHHYRFHSVIWPWGGIFVHEESTHAKTIGKIQNSHRPTHVRRQRHAAVSNVNVGNMYRSGYF